MSLIDVRADESFEERASASVALVAVAPSLHWARKLANPPPDPSFVAQLIATAEQLPPAHNLRSAAPADAIKAYRSVQRGLAGVGLRMRQII
jgi:hypothetical protein